MDVLFVLGSALGGGLIGAGTMAWLAIRQFRSVVGEIRLVRDRIPAPDQAWFWTEDWQAGEVEADADAAAGRTVLFESDVEFDAFLDARSSTASRPE